MIGSKGIMMHRSDEAQRPAGNGCSSSARGDGWEGGRGKTCCAYKWAAPRLSQPWRVFNGRVLVLVLILKWENCTGVREGRR